MENKPQNFSRSINSKACQPSEANRKSSDLQLNKARRRDNSLTARNEQPRTSKQTHNNATKKQQNRFNADKRPRARGGGGSGAGATARGFDAASDQSDDFAPAGSGLAKNDGGSVKWNGHGPSDYELNSVYAAGSKKHNLNHLLNFHYAPREADYAVHGLSFFGRHSGNNNQRNNAVRLKQHKYNKEQFLQANFQFVIRAQAKPKFDASPDALIDWNLIEQINIHTTEEPQCPICLYPPIAAKITRCGHVYCWPCLLHYLSLSDKNWRKCPICYEAIHAPDLKSCTILQQQTINVSEVITFRLMRRRKGSLFIEPYVCALPSVERYPQMSKNDIMQRFSKFLIAKRADVHEILERERKELSASAEVNGEASPESIFIQQALSLLEERFQKLVPSQYSTVNELIEHNELDDQEVNELAVELVAPTETFNQSEELSTIEELPIDADNAVADLEHSETTALTPPNVDITAMDLLASPTAKGPANQFITKYHYFYQSEDGQNNYLHPLNIKMLQACYGSLDKAPLIITAKIVQREQFSMDEEHRRKLTCLSHLPLTCQLSFVEVDLQPPIVSSNILKIFKDDITYRKKERQRRQREECKREKHINELNDRQMGKLIASTANINMSSPEEFPTCGFENLPPLDSNAGRSSDGATAVPVRQNAFSYSTITKADDNWPAAGSPAKNVANSAIWPRYNDIKGKPQQKQQPLMPTATAETGDVVNALSTCLGDVLAEAFSQKQTNTCTKKRDAKQQQQQQQQQQTNIPAQQAAGGAVGGKKKSKKSKKVLPIFATGMNYNGNL